MHPCGNWPNCVTLQERDCIHIIKRLQLAKAKLTPIVNYILLTATCSEYDKCFLSRKQYHDVVVASEIMQDVQCKFTADFNIYNLSNTSPIVANMTSNSPRSGSSTKGGVFIDEDDMELLLKLYTQMGDVIRNVMKRKTESDDETSRSSSPSPRKSLLAAINGSSGVMKKSSTSIRESSGESSATVKRNSSASRQKSQSKSLIKDPSIQTQESKSLSKEASREASKEASREASKEASREASKEAKSCIYIKMQCRSDYSGDDVETITKDCQICKSYSTPHVHVKLGGEAVTLKVNQKHAENGMVYCINTDDDDEEEIKIIIKECPDCCSTVVGSSAGIEEQKPTKPESSRKLELLMDIENVDQSQIKVPSDVGKSSSRHLSPMDPSSEHVNIGGEDLEDAEDTVEPQKQASKKSAVLLTRNRICSSMEFDVTKEDTQLRADGLNHPKNSVLLELEKLGVDQVLRACRPAKCCRKAILNEQQRAGLPYAVSLRSLPLGLSDVDVIKESIDMSLRKIKNSTNIQQDLNDPLSYYVQLGADDYQANINFPWVLPTYYNVKDVQLKRSTLNCKNESVLKLKKTASNKSTDFFDVVRTKRPVSKSIRRLFNKNPFSKDKSPSNSRNDRILNKNGNCKVCFEEKSYETDRAVSIKQKKSTTTFAINSSLRILSKFRQTHLSKKKRLSFTRPKKESATVISKDVSEYRIESREIGKDGALVCMERKWLFKSLSDSDVSLKDDLIQCIFGKQRMEKNWPQYETHQGDGLYDKRRKNDVRYKSSPLFQTPLDGKVAQKHAFRETAIDQSGTVLNKDMKDFYRKFLLNDQNRSALFKKLQKDMGYYLALKQKGVPITSPQYDTFFTNLTKRGSFTDIKPEGQRTPAAITGTNDTLSELEAEDLGLSDKNDGIKEVFSRRDLKSPSVDSVEDDWMPFIVSAHSLPTFETVTEVSKKASIHPLSTPAQKGDTAVEVPKGTKRKLDKEKTKVIFIQIEKRKRSSGLDVNAVSLKTCNKEVCQLYKNRYIVDGSTECSEEESGCRGKKLRLDSNNSLEILIKDNVVSVNRNIKKAH